MKKKTKEKQPEQIHEGFRSELRVGSIVIGSCDNTAAELCSLVCWMLQQKEIKSYLKGHTRTKLKNTMCD